MESAHVRRPAWSWSDEDASPKEEVETPATSDIKPEAEGCTDSAAASGSSYHGDFHHDHEANPASAPSEPSEPATQQRHYKPRVCRICLDVVQPTTILDESASFTPRVFRAKPRVRYVSEDAELGRLISPCKCKGSQKYVHEGCLQAWRKTSPLSDRNFWRCPTCGFEYRLQRLRWGKWISGRISRAVLTLSVFVLALFVLGFVADPINNLWLDPLGSIADNLLEEVNVGAFRDELHVEDPNTWSFHFLKGILSMGLLGFVKTFFTLFPWQWTIHRYVGGRRRGRTRLENINWGLVVVGVITFLAAVWKGISYMSARALERISERVVDVQGSDELDEDDEELASDDAQPVDETLKEQ